VPQVPSDDSLWEEVLIQVLGIPQRVAHLAVAARSEAITYHFGKAQTIIP
jgi:hypothetical protein